MNNGRRDDILSGHWQEGWSTGWTWDRRCDILRGEGQERWCTDWTQWTWAAFVVTWTREMMY